MADLSDQTMPSPGELERLGQEAWAAQFRCYHCGILRYANVTTGKECLACTSRTCRYGPRCERPAVQRRFMKIEPGATLAQVITAWYGSAAEFGRRLGVSAWDARKIAHHRDYTISVSWEMRIAALLDMDLQTYWRIFDAAARGSMRAAGAREF